ncbi:Bsp6I family type II restriction endonuclease [Candidatus Woesearchaeota archaeon]|nr:Bsp6I family type II restriction endonuclease [Candidatus Woesearchaeota archaeon]
MKIIWARVNVNGNSIYAQITHKEEKDKELLNKLYFEWKKLNENIKKISTRGINLPEAISENAFCLFFESVFRVVRLQKGKCSYDCVDNKTGKRIQIKASSVKSDLTSFGPKSEWDDLYFLDFSKGDGTFLIYKIEKEWIYNHKVNRQQTFEEQQKQSRRPRFSIIKEIINPRKLKPVKICKL